MYHSGIFSAILMSGILKLACGTDYCDPKLCTSNGVVLEHIGCEHSGKFARNCVKPAVIPVSPYLKQVILHEHNDLRNKVANGSLPGFQTAKRMLTLTWDSELAYLAQLNVLQCEMEHDQCHNTIAYKYSGQNIGVQYQTDPLYPAEYESLIIFLIHEWFNEYKFTKQRDTDKCLRINRANEIGHFTELLQERTSKVGCGISRYVKFLHGEDWDTILFACNYNYGNMVGLPTYITGSMASACKTGSNPEFNGLCSLYENVPPIPESEEVVPLHPVFTNKKRLMQTATSDERQAGRSSLTKPGRPPGQSNFEQLLGRAVARADQRAIIRTENRPRQTGSRHKSSIIEEGRIAAPTFNLRPVPVPRGIRAPQGPRGIGPLPLPRSVNVPPPVPFPRGQSRKNVPIRRAAPAHFDNESEEDLPPPLPLQPPPTWKQSAPLRGPVRTYPIKPAQKYPLVTLYPAINRQVRPVPLYVPVHRVLPAQLDSESEEDLPPPLPIQPPPNIKQSGYLTRPDRANPIKQARRYPPVIPYRRLA